jgi:hypothetical protein
MKGFNWEKIRREDAFLRTQKILIPPREQMSRQLPSEKQLLFVQSLGYSGKKPSSKLHASHIIETCLTNKRIFGEKHSYM